MIGILYVILILVTLLAAASVVLPLWEAGWRSKRHAPGIFTGLLIIAFFFTAAFSLYHVFGNAPLLSQIVERDRQLRTHRQETGKLQRQLATAPRNPALWMQLGLTHLELGHYDDTVIAFRQASLLTEGDPAILLLYAKALTLQAGGVITPEAKTAFSMTVLQDPGNVEARFFLIMEQRQQGEEDAARTALTQLDRETDAPHPLKAAIQSALRDLALPSEGMNRY